MGTPYVTGRRVVTIVLLGVAAGLLGSPPVHAAVSCSALTPSSDPAANRVAIQGCLNGPERQALLTPGSYPVDGGIVVPSGARLVGDTATYPTIRLVANPSPSWRRELVCGRLDVHLGVLAGPLQPGRLPAPDERQLGAQRRILLLLVTGQGGVVGVHSAAARVRVRIGGHIEVQLPEDDD